MNKCSGQNGLWRPDSSGSFFPIVGNFSRAFSNRRKKREGAVTALSNRWKIGLAVVLAGVAAALVTAAGAVLAAGGAALLTAAGTVFCVPVGTGVGAAKVLSDVAPKIASKMAADKFFILLLLIIMRTVCAC